MYEFKNIQSMDNYTWKTSQTSYFSVYLIDFFFVGGFERAYRNRQVSPIWPKLTSSPGEEAIANLIDYWTLYVNSCSVWKLTMYNWMYVVFHTDCHVERTRWGNQSPGKYIGVPEFDGKSIVNAVYKECDWQSIKSCVCYHTP